MPRARPTTACPDWVASQTIHPCFDVGAGLARATGFTSSLGPLLVLQEVEHHRHSIFRALYAYGPGTRARRISGVILPSDVLVPHRELYRTVARQGNSQTLLCHFRRGERITVNLLGHRVRLTLDFPKCGVAPPAGLDRVAPCRVLLWALCEAAPRELFASRAELRRRLRLPRGTRVLFEFDDFQTVPSLQPLGRSPDFLAMGTALAEKVLLRTLPGKPDSTWQHWLKAQLAGLCNAHRMRWDQTTRLMYADDD